MIDLLKKLFDKSPKNNMVESKDNMDIICNGSTNDLNSFCSLEYAYMNRRSN